MEILLTIAFVFLAISIFLIFNIKTQDFVKLAVSLDSRNKEDFRREINKRENRLLNFFNQTKTMLLATGQKSKFIMVIVGSCILVALGISVALFIGNIYLAPTAGIAFGAIPFIFIRFQFIEYNKLVVEELSNAMSAVTSSYERSDNILLSFKENLTDTAEPIKSIFESFVNEIENVNPNYEKAIDNMKCKIDNSVWVEWCEALKRCSKNRNIKFVLSPIVIKLSKIKVVTGELQNLLMNATKDYWILLVAALGLLYVGIYILPSGLMIEIPKTLSNILIAVNCAIALLTSIKVLLITHEIKFDL